MAALQIDPSFVWVRPPTYDRRHTEAGGVPD